jgi:predicted nucleic acid-binding protein
VRVYAESNFVLEIVLAQEQHKACKDFVTLADRHEVELVLPAFSLFEPYTTLERRRQERHKLREQLERELTQIRRTQAFAKEASASSLPALLVESTQEAADQFNWARESLLRVARLLPLTTEVLRAALVAEVTHELEFPDAIVLASVLDDLAVSPSPSCFLNRNTNDFDDPGVRDALAAHDRRVFGSFDNGLRYVRSQLPAASPGA